MAIKVALWGFGHMNKITLTYVLEQGYQLVAVIGHHDVGKDAGEVAGVAACGVHITHEDHADAELKKVKPDVCILATRSLIKDQVPSLKVLASNRVNVVTIGEEALYAWNTSPEIAKEIDEVFRANGATFTATGAQDHYWVSLPALMLGTTHKVETIVGGVSYNVDDYGMALCELHGCGMKADKFDETFNKPDAPPAYVWNSNEALASRMKWKILETKQTCYPVTAPKEIHSKSLKANIPAGDVIGLRAVVITKAEDSKGNIIHIETNQIGAVYYDDMEDYTSWQTTGVPSLNIQCKKPDTVGITCASSVNRIKSVIAARAGYVTISELGPMC